MKILVITLAVASVVATSAVANTKMHTEHVDRSNIYQSDSLGINRIQIRTEGLTQHQSRPGLNE